MAQDTKGRDASKRITGGVQESRGFAGRGQQPEPGGDAPRAKVFETGEHIHNPPQMWQPSENPHATGSEPLDAQLERHLNRG